MASDEQGVAPARVIGVVGAGTMGAGIAQLACRSGARTLLHDPDAEALSAGAQRIEEDLARLVDRDRLSDSEAQAARQRLETVGELGALAPCELIIEAAPERLELKHELYRALSEIVGERCVLATNTSSLLVTAIAAAAQHPERVVGMHFFNPAPVMRLVEVVAGAQSGEKALALAQATGQAMKRTVIRAADGPGFLVNRCNRPFGLEALRLLAEGAADVPTIDRICRLGGGFRMGPFELMDLVGVDVGLEVARSFFEQSFGEPRWRPSPISTRMVAAGRLGRKTGRGFYRYDDGPHRSPDPDPDAAPLAGAQAPGGAPGGVVIGGHNAVAIELRRLAAAAGWEAREDDGRGASEPFLTLDCDAQPSRAPGPRALLCGRGSLGALDRGAGAVGFYALAPLSECRLVELTRGPASRPLAAERAEHFFTTLGFHTEWVGDAPGLVLGRIVCQLINEASFALGEGVGSAQDIDTGMVLGLNHPRGPLAWADAIGLDHVLGVLEALSREYREERYRPAPALRQLVWAGRLGHQTGGGFHDQRS